MNNEVTLEGWYGGDTTHAMSAWTSTLREMTGERRDRVDKLLKMLAENGHHTPFEKSMLHFVVTCDTASHIHLLKHRIGVSINAESARYKELKGDKFYIPDDWPEDTVPIFKTVMSASYTAYHQLVSSLEPSLGRKRAKESARFLLPYANQVTMDISFNFRSFMHFQGLRNKPDAQREIQQIAQQMLDKVRHIGAFDLSLMAFGYL